MESPLTRNPGSDPDIASRCIPVGENGVSSGAGSGRPLPSLTGSWECCWVNSWWSGCYRCRCTVAWTDPERRHYPLINSVVCLQLCLQRKWINVSFYKKYFNCRGSTRKRIAKIDLWCHLLSLDVAQRLVVHLSVYCLHNNFPLFRNLVHSLSKLNITY